MTTDTTALQERIERAIQDADADTLDYERRPPDYGYGTHAAAVLPIVEAEVRAAKAEALRGEADRISRLANEPQLIEYADKYAGFYAGIRAALQNEVGSLRVRATEYETGDQA